MPMLITGTLAFLPAFNPSHAILKEGSREGLPMVDSRIPSRGKLAAEAGKVFPLEVCKSAAGYYLGTLNEEGEPFTRESVEYWRKQEAAEAALAKGAWTQKPNL